MARIWPARASAPVLWACFCREQAEHDATNGADA
jgi:hypothetical protein